MKTLPVYLALLIGVGLLISPLVHAQTVVYSTIDPNATTYTFTTDDLNGINYPILDHPAGSPPGTYQSYADQFTPSFNFTLSSIAVGARTIPQNNFGDLNAIIYANDPNTNLPLTASPLATSTAVAPMGTGSAGQTVDLTLFDFSSASLSMLAGQTYWIALEPAKEGTDVEWGFTTNGTHGQVAENLNRSGYDHFTGGGPPGSDAQFGAFQIFAVPEPTTTALLGAGTIFLTLIGVRRYRRSVS